MALRSDTSKTLKGFQKLKDNLLPLNIDVIGHYYYLKKELKDSDVRYMKKNPGFKEIKKLLKDVGRRCEKYGRRRKKVRMKALTSSNIALNAASAVQLCYDGQVVDKIDRYVFLGQFVGDKLERCESIMLVKSFPNSISVTA